MVTSFNVSLVWTFRSSSLLSRRWFDNQAKVRSTTHGRGGARKSGGVAATSKATWYRAGVAEAAPRRREGAAKVRQMEAVPVCWVV
jgi:hypothetical protein